MDPFDPIVLSFFFFIVFPMQKQYAVCFLGGCAIPKLEKWVFLYILKEFSEAGYGSERVFFDNRFQCLTFDLQ